MTPAPEANVGDQRIDVGLRLQEVRAAQTAWGEFSVADRLKLIRLFRQRLIAVADTLHEHVPIASRTPTQTLTSEIMPLAAACRWLEKHATKTLRGRRIGVWGRPPWLLGVRGNVTRVPHGVVLILGTWNYPIFLTGVQLLQALVAGNGVLVKPGTGCQTVTKLLLHLLGDMTSLTTADGLLPELADLTETPACARHLPVALLDESAEAGAEAMNLGVDHVVLTGSAATGRRVLAQAAETVTPCTVELSGCDAMIVMQGADDERAAKAIRFGLSFNASATCIAPRRILVADFELNQSRTSLERTGSYLVAGDESTVSVPFVEQLLKTTLPSTKTRPSEQAWSGVDELVADAQQLGAVIHDHRGDPDHGWLVIDRATPEMRITQTDVFAPVVSIIRCRSMDELIAACNACPYALAASVFGTVAEVTAITPHVRAGTVTINDVIVPTADPRVPFGGYGESGFGVTRGPEGLLAMTRPHVLMRRQNSFLPHLDEEHPVDHDLLSGLAQLLYGRGRWEGLKRLMNAGRRRSAKGE